MAGDDTDFPEYDPTPYGGGYDPEDVYGKSAAPSEKSCYPPHRDGDDITDLSSLRDGDDDNHSVISAYGVELPEDFYTPPQIAKPKPSNPRTANPDTSNHNHTQPADVGSTPQQEPQSNDGQWNPPYFNYDAPMNYYSFDIFDYSPPKEEEQDSSYAYEPTDDISEKVARWLFSSTYI